MVARRKEGTQGLFEIGHARGFAFMANANFAHHDAGSCNAAVFTYRELDEAGFRN
jgi:hypothetical protein